MSVVFVTGATGFIGRHLCPALVQAGHTVRAGYTGDAEGAASPGVVWVKHPRLEVDFDWRPLLKEDIAYVVHLAGVAHRLTKPCPPAVYEAVNHQATARLADAVARSGRVQRLVFVSSVAVAEAREGIVDENASSRPITPYGESKYRAEVAIRERLHATAADWAVLRPPLVYGPGNPGNMARLIALLKTGLPLPFAGLQNRRSFLYVGNLVSAIRTLCVHPAASRRVFYATDGPPLSTPDLVRGLAEAAGRRVRLWRMPQAGWRALAASGLGRETLDKLRSSLIVDDRAFRHACAWSPAFSASEGFRDTLQANG